VEEDTEKGVRVHGGSPFGRWWSRGEFAVGLRGTCDRRSATPAMLSVRR